MKYRYTLTMLSLTAFFIYSLNSLISPVAATIGEERYSFITKIGSNGSGDGEFNIPHTIAFDSSGNMYVTDTKNSRVQKFDSDGMFLLKWGSKGAGNGRFQGPEGIDIDSKSNVYVAD